jgi:hypothetical protein
MAAEALTGHIGVMRETGKSVPDPSTLDEVMGEPDFRDGVAFLVSVEEPGKKGVRNHQPDRAGTARD